ncbi:MAG: FAD-binding protein [Nitriliruptoraceae bacterium]
MDPSAAVRSARVHAQRVRTDVAIIGAGAAGLYAASVLDDGLDVVVIDKGRIDHSSGSSPWAQGGLAAAVGEDDDPAQHAHDTMMAGDGLCDASAVDVLTRNAPRHVEALVTLGAAFDRDASGALSLAREGGQHRARSVRRADATGAELIRVLRHVAAARVSRLEGIAIELGRADDGTVGGVWVLADGQLVAVEARAVVLATGGSGALFAATTNPAGATGDALALASAAGAAVRDVEFVQFHPTALAATGQRRFLLTEALRGAGATLHDVDGHRFMQDVHPDGELAPRHIVAGAILDQTDAVAYLDATILGSTVLEHEFPTAMAGAGEAGFDLRTDRVPVTPAAHYHMGGVRTDLFGRTSAPGLFACGEAASTGVHGANRLAGNSLSEALVFGARAAETAEAELRSHAGPLGLPPRLARHRRDDAATRLDDLRIRMLRDAGPRRSASALADLDAWLAEQTATFGAPVADRDSIEVHHALRAAALIVRAAQLRNESRGGHYRSDAPTRDPKLDGVHLELIADVVGQ